ncbi:MAG: ATP-binding protein, partial [Caldilineaceae bacterium]|nr:ATP-binding protein [Caldilineaceae bacterium]
MKLSDRNARARQQRFVGRQAELELFRTTLLAKEPAFAVLHIYGPGGAGKTSLLHELARLATQQGRPTVYLDGRDVEPEPAAVKAALGSFLTAANGVLLIDTYERLAGLDGWLRGVFLPQLPAASLIVIAGRQVPTTWREDAAWADLTRIIALGNLPVEESHAYLAARGVPEPHHTAVLAFTRGHPLALSLVAELYRQGDAVAFGDTPAAYDVIRVLMERFVRDAPSSQHRKALELCAIARTTTEAMLANLFDADVAFELFQWLRQLSFIEHGPYGIFPHDLVREVLDADLHWRNPGDYAELQQAALTYLRRAAQVASGQERQRLRMDTIYINRRAPGMRDFFVWDSADTVYAEPAARADFPAIIDMVARHEGDASAAIARHWLARQPDRWLVYRTTGGELYGCMAQLALERATPEDAAIDPAVAAALAHVGASHPIQPGDTISHMRFWMARDTYQAIAVAVNVTAANCVIHWTSTPRLVWSFVTMANPELMAPHFQSIHFHRTPAAEFAIGGRHYGVFSHNWALMPVSAWQIDTR